ncbi:hypothetical protein EVAR_45716_1 [Eumeta japonica]|uniref:Uncharacterized protein n=1 Tax=Eumeta variegata TaxID=151549 RepID=A0A4C1WZ81_EUMVA|nr:hypothetical protein EVAR_45716_1 [Eumeta japonica]
MSVRRIGSLVVCCVCADVGVHVKCGRYTAAERTRAGRDTAPVRALTSEPAGGSANTLKASHDRRPCSVISVNVLKTW